MDMERRINGGVGGVAIVLMILALANCVNAQRSEYSCWGGCYNGCIPITGRTEPERLGCYYQCLVSCIPRSPADFQNYCQIGCSLKRCIPVSNDGARLESCFGVCTNICRRL